MRNIFKKSLFILIASLIASTALAETMYVVSGKCNVPLKAGMNSAQYQIFTWDGTVATATTAITSSITGAGGSYYNSTSLTLNDLKTTTKYSTGSSSNRTMQALKLPTGNALTISLGSKTMSKIVVVVRPASGDQLSIDVLGETISSKSSSTFYVIEKVQNFSGNVTIANNTTGKEYHFFVYMVEGQAGPSSDATLKSLKYDNTSVPSFSSSTYTYNVELPAGTTTVPTVTAEKNDSKAPNPVITQAANLPGTATVVVTAEDGTTSLTYTINFTVASSYPKVLTATWANIAGTATIDEVNKTITGKVAQGTGLTAITPTLAQVLQQSLRPSPEITSVLGLLKEHRTSAMEQSITHSRIVLQASK